MTRLGVVVNAEKAKAEGVLTRLSELARRDGVELLVAKDRGVDCGGSLCVDLAEMRGEHVEAILVVGGDGTVLNTVRALDGHDVPLMGVNAGSLGFLTSVTASEVELAFNAVVTGETTCSRRSLLSCRIEREGEHRLLAHALNDCVISRGASARVVCLELAVDDVTVTDFVCDGLIVATPTGSTAYSLSAGGPIVLPTTAAMVISLICPHALGSRPLVMPEGAKIAVTVREASGPANVSADGEVEHELAEGDQVVVERSDREVSFIHLPGYDPFEVMRRKLGWHATNSGRARRG